VTTEKGDEMDEIDDRRTEKRARTERIDRLWEEFDTLLRENEAIFDKWRAEGLLPPEEPHRRF
jgi:hypothetical protein